jgi:hypothetical protein
MLDTRLMQEVLRSEFDRPEAVIHLFIGGSELHGAKVGATDDRRNGPEDVDLTLYSLRRWAQLAAKGNATALHFVFANATATSNELWGMVQARRDLFISKQSAAQFLGFAGNQLRRITGEQGRGAKGRRPEYESVFGYDTKAAMHCLRLYLECIELMRLGTITLPRPEREFLIEARSGNWTLERFLSEAEGLRREAEDAAQKSSLPETVDVRAISELLAKVYLTAWQT